MREDGMRQPPGTGVIIMGGKTDMAKGRIEEAAGTLTGDDQLRNRGKIDQSLGRVKQTFKKVGAKLSKRMRG
jgi:uncharacterized protein YjbJ (UPF0337 family)